MGALRLEVFQPFTVFQQDGSGIFPKRGIGRDGPTFVRVRRTLGYMPFFSGIISRKNCNLSSVGDLHTLAAKITEAIESFNAGDTSKHLASN